MVRPRRTRVMTTLGSLHCRCYSGGIGLHPVQWYQQTLRYTSECRANIKYELRARGSEQEITISVFPCMEGCSTEQERLHEQLKAETQYPPPNSLCNRV